MARQQDIYILDYRRAEGIIITSPNGREVFPVVSPPNLDPDGSPLTPFHYDPTPHHLVQDGTIDSFTITQRYIRIWDMIKDGSKSSDMNDKIIELMNDPRNRVPSYEHFAEMRKKLVTLPNISAKITKSSWIKPNTYETEHNKLIQRFVYQESGISPSTIIENPNYVVNIANTVIDPFTRDFSSNRTTKTYFPGEDNRVEITPAFFNFMGFSHCDFIDEQRATGITEAAHEYRLQVSPNITIRAHNTPNPPGPVHEDGWYAGNKTKNDNFNVATDDQKIALLNVKELGDVLQVFLMFIFAHTLPGGSIHTMVTCDSVVFMMCIMFGLDCVYYHHERRANGHDHGENHVYHFNARYTLENAQTYFINTRNTIRAHNTELMTSIFLIKQRRIPIFMSEYDVIRGFYFCEIFLQNIIDDIAEINAKLMELDPTQLILAGANADANIARLNNYTFQLKLYYKIKVLFTTRARGGVTFSGIYSKYTEKPTPLRLADVGLVQDDIIMNQQDNANEVAQINDEQDEEHVPNQPQLGAIFTPADGWKLNGYNRGTPFYTLYINHYANVGDCMHPTERRKAGREERARRLAEQEAQYAYMQFLLRNPNVNNPAVQRENENIQNAPSTRKRKPNNISGGVMASTNKTSPKKFSHSRKTSRNKYPSKWDIFELDLNQTVWYIEKKSACKDHIKPSQCADKSKMDQNSDFFPPVNIHREWIHDILSYIVTFCRKHKGAQEIFNVHKQDFFREMYEYCDNYNVVLTGKALEKLAHKTIRRIINLHHTYLTPARANKASIQKPLTYTISPTMFKQYVAQMKNKEDISTRLGYLPQTASKQLVIESQFRPVATAGGRRTRKRSKNKSHRTRNISHTRR